MTQAERTERRRRGRRREERLSPDDWAEAALEALVERGVEGVNVRELSRRLDVARASFYWHFKDREALLRTALRMWEQRATYDYIAKLKRIADPRERIRTLLLDAFAHPGAGRMFAALNAATAEPLVVEALGRALRARHRFLEQTFREMEFDATEAAQRARLVSEIYTGLWQTERILPSKGGRLDRRLSLSAHLRFLADWLTR